MGRIMLRFPKYSKIEYLMKYTPLFSCADGMDVSFKVTGFEIFIANELDKGI